MKKLFFGLLSMTLAPSVLASAMISVWYGPSGFYSAGAELNGPIDFVYVLNSDEQVVLYEGHNFTGNSIVIEEKDGMVYPRFTNDEYDFPLYRSAKVIATKFEQIKPEVEPVSAAKGERCLVSMVPRKGGFYSGGYTVNLTEKGYEAVTLRGKATNISNGPLVFKQDLSTEAFGSGANQFKTYSVYSANGQATDKQSKLTVPHGGQYIFEVTVDLTELKSDVLTVIMQDGNHRGQLGSDDITLEYVEGVCR